MALKYTAASSLRLLEVATEVLLRPAAAQFSTTSQVSTVTDLTSTTKRNGELRCTTGLGLGDGFKSHTEKWMQPTVNIGNPSFTMAIPNCCVMSQQLFLSLAVLDVTAGYTRVKPQLATCLSTGLPLRRRFESWCWCECRSQQPSRHRSGSTRLSPSQ